VQARITVCGRSNTKNIGNCITKKEDYDLFVYVCERAADAAIAIAGGAPVEKAMTDYNLNVKD